MHSPNMLLVSPAFDVTMKQQNIIKALFFKSRAIFVLETMNEMPKQEIWDDDTVINPQIAKLL